MTLFHERKSHFKYVILLLTSGFWLSSGVIPTVAQNPAPMTEVENQIPKHIPIQVKAKNLQTGRVMRDLEIEVTNTSSRPIYYLKIDVHVPGVVTDDGKKVSMPLRYGRFELLNLDNHAQADDVPLRPGESYVFRLPEIIWKGWEDYAAEKNLQISPQRLVIRFHALSFGDGTGFRGTKGVSVPSKPAAVPGQAESVNRNPAKPWLLLSAWLAATPGNSRIDWLISCPQQSMKWR